MIEIEINAENSKEILEEIQRQIGGKIEEKWSENTLHVNNDIAEGTIRYIPFDWGVNLLDYNITFKEDVVLKMHASDYNPIRFIYALNGSFKHRFGVDKKEEEIEQYQTLIFTNKTVGINYIHFPKHTKLDINSIQIIRKHFLKKRTTNVSTLNKKLYEVFVDTDHDNRFAHYGTLNLKMADLVKKTRNVKGKGMLRILKIEAKIYEILSIHIQQHNKLQQGVPLPTSLIKSELITVRKLGQAILKRPAKDYSLDQLSANSGLSQAKLQDGFKFLYTRTVTEYIRHVRLEAARELMTTTDLNITQIVYSIGFTSRSYFSKIFKEKYGVTPNEFKKQLIVPIAI
ncbi:helix-turn-helix transcriptional regulator [Algibacter amylolyticus]|uniref:Helix-turn-helix transcriptional regulator n=1 Tax=Algibacter amylolyticus TaxID=1608400 RepID=A0A5M7B0C8_9FLAO|nr:AraC family transcriptional regulator [Algibacter amylolyticus]KAA5820601.1 helix-turn-helix transcriptional regulator [Algibacter amylolyticus]MBB5269935.1 AraC-like DNA-binding protein [Algibacter amylolyticus]TSJ71274.1 helix-turn-helix transcriptional regulator [Algibacter amylolyticus]